MGNLRYSHLNNEENNQSSVEVPNEFMEAMEVVDPILLNEVLSLVAWWGYVGVPLVIIVIMTYSVYREFIYTKK